MESFSREEKHCSFKNIRKGKTRVRNTRLLHESKKCSKIQLEEIDTRLLHESKKCSKLQLEENKEEINVDISGSDVSESSCRLCLDMISSIPTPIWGEDSQDYSLKILQCCSITVSKDDPLTFLCQICLSKLEKLTEFQQMCQRNDLKLKEINFEKDCQRCTQFVSESNHADVSNESFAENEENYENFWISEDTIEIKGQGKRDKEYHCTDCPMICTDKLEFRIHRKSHKCLSSIQKCTIQNKYLCYVYNCRKEFKYFKELVEHQKKCHKDQTIASPKYLCQYCGIFLLKRSMRHHIRLHSSKIPVVCETCGITLSSPSTLYKHVLSKHSVKKFTLCPECGKRIAIISLRKHIRRVHCVPHYICQYCDRKFGCGYNLKSHLRTHTGEMPFSCPDCGKAFRHRVTMKHHRLKVHDVNMFDNPSPTFDNFSECQKERKLNNNVTCKET